MSDLTRELLKLIDEGKTINEISEKLNISNKRIYNILSLIRNKGFEFERKYYYNGDILYIPKKSFVEINKEGTDIITSSNDRSFEALVISDLHIGSTKERIDLLDKLYDWCSKEGIHIIIVCGDIIDGMYGRNKKIHNNVGEQIDYMLKNYPFDKSILNFVTLGDHDYDAFRNYGQNLARIFESYRHDIIPLGYCFGQINVKNDKIYVRHPSDSFNEVKLQPLYNCLMLNGHSHKMCINATSNVTTVTVPSLSEIHVANITTLPTAIRMKLNFKNGLIYRGVFSQLLIGKKIYTLSEFNCPLWSGKDFESNTSITLEEEFDKKKILQLSRTQSYTD